jgi:ABC-type proline/glycine betaine transport system substrate-binding protein
MATMRALLCTANLLAGSLADVFLAKEDKPTIVLATPYATYHNATLQIYKRLLEDNGYSVEPIFNIPHKDMYPHFTGQNTSDYVVDIVVSADLPNNHFRFLGDYLDVFEVIGTCYEILQIFFAAPDYTGLSSISDIAGSSVNKTILGFDVLECPVCPDLADKWISERLPGFTSEPLPKSELTAEIEGKLERKEDFVVTMYAPMFYGAKFPQLKKLDMENYTADIFNQGKALIRKDAVNKLDERTLRKLSAVFIGSDELSKMDYEIYQRQQSGSGDNAVEEVALEWIRDNQKTFDMFSW